MSREVFENAVAALVEATRPGKANVQVAATAKLGRTRQATARARAHPGLPVLCRRLAVVREDNVLPPLRSLSRMLDVLHDFSSAVEALADPAAPGQLALLACAAVEHDAA